MRYSIGRQAQLAPIDGHLAAGQIQAQRPEVQHRLLGRAGLVGVAERHPHARQQLVQAERLGQVVVGARRPAPCTLSPSCSRAEITMMGVCDHSRTERVHSTPS